MFNNEKFAMAVRLKRGKQSLRDVASQIKVSAATLSRLENGDKPDIDTFFALCEWMEIETNFFKTK